MLVLASIVSSASHEAPASVRRLAPGRFRLKLRLALLGVIVACCAACSSASPVHPLEDAAALEDARLRAGFLLWQGQAPTVYRYELERSFIGTGGTCEGFDERSLVQIREGKVEAVASVRRYFAPPDRRPCDETDGAIRFVEPDELPGTSALGMPGVYAYCQELLNRKNGYSWSVSMDADGVLTECKGRPPRGLMDAPVLTAGARNFAAGSLDRDAMRSRLAASPEAQ